MEPSGSCSIENSSAHGASAEINRTGPNLRSTLLSLAKVDALAIQRVFCRAKVAAADHGLAAAQLASRDEPQGAAPWTGHNGYEWVLRMAQLGLVFQHENRSGIHSLGDPFFQKLQVG
jgi:hypothetical protein